MGVKTEISLYEINKLFPSYGFTKLIPTTSGIMDTTYILSSKKRSCILKKYEREMGERIKQDRELLKELKSIDLNVPLCIDESSGWYLYEKLQGAQPKSIRSYYIQALARFLAKFHSHTHKRISASDVVEKKKIIELLKGIKPNFFFYYKKLCPLKKYKAKNDGLIHGDIFKDNTVFEGRKIGVFDFVDSGCGEFAFDAAVTLVGFDVKKENTFALNLFLRTYNQHAPKKLRRDELLTSMQTASKFYALKRVQNTQKSAGAKELLRYF